MRLFGAIEKYDKREDGTLLVCGIAGSEAFDSDGQTITADAMKSALPDYMRFGNVREMHNNHSAAGVCLAADVMPDGKTRIETLIVDPTAIKKITTGVYKGFSIGGDVLSVQGKAITRLQLKEISLVDRPANPEAIFDLWKADKSNKVMIESKTFAKALSLPETATESEIIDAFTKKLAPAAPSGIPNLDEIIAKAVKAASPDNSVLNATIEKLDKSMKDLSARAEAADAIAQRTERKNLVDQAGREGKLIPLDDEHIYGSIEKGISATPISTLKMMVEKAQKVVPTNRMAPFRIKEGDKEVEVTIEEARKTGLKKETREELCKAAKARSIGHWDKFFAGQNQN